MLLYRGPSAIRPKANYSIEIGPTTNNSPVEEDLTIAKCQW